MTALGSHLRAFTHSRAYASVRKEFRTAGTSGVTMVQCEQPPGHYRRPAADEVGLSLVLSRCTRLKIDHGTRWEGEAPPVNDLILGPRRTDLGYEIIGSTRYIIAILPSRFVRSALHREGGPAWSGDFGRLHDAYFSDPTISALMLRIWQEALAGTRESALVADTAWTSLAALLLRVSGQCSPSTVRGGLAGWQLRRITEHIQDRLAEDVSLSDLASLAGLSPRHLCTAFRESTGLPPHRWQIERRVERAKAMLADPAATITDVALACGFGTPSHFATMFRRATGCAPSRWRRERLR
jgi:AraC family transcriptional regulator